MGRGQHIIQLWGEWLAMKLNYGGQGSKHFRPPPIILNAIALKLNLHFVSLLYTGKGMGIVRLINRKTADRALIKGFHGRVTDISFAHLTAIILGSVDEIGNMFIHEFQETQDEKIEYLLI